MKTIKKLNHKGDVSILFIILIIILLGLGGGFYVWQKNANKSSSDASSSSSESKPTSEEKPVATETKPKACQEPGTTVTDNIEASVTSGNTAALEGYMASNVTVILAATEGIGEQTPAQAVKDVTDFIGDITKSSWDFNLSASVLSSYGKGSYKQYFPNNAVVGKSSDSKVISFSFDCTAKISTIFEAGSEKLLN